YLDGICCMGKSTIVSAMNGKKINTAIKANNSYFPGMCTYLNVAESIKSGVLDRSPLNCFEWNLLWHFIKRWIETKNIKTDELDFDFKIEMEQAFECFKNTDAYKMFSKNFQVSFFDIIISL